MREPPGIVDPVECLVAFPPLRPVIRAIVGNEIPGQSCAEVEGSHLGALLLHPEAEVAACLSDLKHALVFEIDAAEIGFLSPAQVPLALEDAVTRDFGGVIKIAGGCVDAPWLGMQLFGNG